MSEEIATLGGGCFWCLEAVYVELQGVVRVESGYMGGAVANPSYNAVCTGKTGHVEVVQVSFDAALITYADILRVFFSIHDPTTLNRQGGDVGTQYRSAIFTHSPEQADTARAVVAEIGAAGLWPNPIVTEINSASAFYAAEDYHQEYFAHNVGQPYCQVVIAPKVAKFRKQWRDRLVNA